MIVYGKMVVNMCMSMWRVSESFCWVHSLRLTTRIMLVMLPSLAVVWLCRCCVG
jgi:hypothetical protein